MKQIAKETYYQQQKAALLALKQESESEFSRMTPAERQAFEQHRQALINRSKEKLSAAFYQKSAFGRWKFQWAARRALFVARHFAMDVTVEADTCLGVITLVTDQLLSNTHWKDGRYKRALLRLMRRADSVSIAAAENETVKIILDYTLAVVKK